MVTVGQRRKLVMGGLLIAAAVAYLGWNSFQNFSEYYVPVAKLLSQQAVYRGKDVRVQGKILANTVIWRPRQQYLRFELAGGGKELPVVYHGVDPSNNNQDVNAVVEGKLVGGVFQARRVLTQCATHYKAQQG
ncbi:MAG: cytochrome c maturation protein CcmE [Thermaerobacter sp.]|nr:cytochrome c maturation protein CcmE [Thermaerobacter sp.]